MPWPDPDTLQVASHLVVPMLVIGACVWGFSLWVKDELGL